MTTNCLLSLTDATESVREKAYEEAKHKPLSFARKAAEARGKFYLQTEDTYL